MVTPVGFEPTTCGLEVRCSIQLSYGALMVERLMGPRLFAVKPEVFRIGRCPDLALFLIGKLVGNAIALSVGNSLFLAVEIQPDLLLHIR